MINYITGSSGFVGSYLLKALNKKVICIPHNQIMNAKLEPFDSFYFLSAYGNMYFHIGDGQIIQANISDLIHLLLEAMKYRFKSFIYISTSSVELEVQTMYSRTKRAAEEILLAFTEKYNLPICIIRPYSITGVGEQKEHLIPTLIKSCFTGELVNFVPDPCHDWIDVRDIVNEIIRLSEARTNGIFEIGSGILTSNKEVLELVEKITGRKANINIVENLRLYDNKSWCAEKQTGKISLEDTIKSMVETYVKRT
ncbi:NAD(P)-dependent oxidoreductase [Candidatus Gottesmanbacteria bacterium]|nr:NAD(P)-dependent oxidoreductase [Candidatus Gottesmanbacteria bacterium]